MDGAQTWRSVVLRGYLGWTAGLCAAASLILLGFGFPTAAAILTTFIGIVYLGLYLLIGRAPNLAPWVGLYIMVQLVGVFLFLGVSTVADPIVAMAGMVTVPAATTFLADRRFVPPMWLLSMVAMLGWVLARTHEVASLPNVVSVGCISASIAVLTWLAERQREIWQVRAELQREELAAAVEEARSAAHARSAFLATMSHEIRTPLNGVLGLTRLLGDTDLDPTQRELAETAISSGRLLQGVVDDILDLARLESGRLELDPRPLSPLRVLDEVVRLMQTQADERGLALETLVDDDVPRWVRGDDTRLSQVLVNLVGNAIKFTERGRVRVHVQRTAEGLRMDVLDTGIGIDTDQIDTLFEPFVQAEASTTRRYGGSGLGLAICARLCERMGGRIGAEPRPEGGSRFWFELPLERCPPPSVIDGDHDDLSDLDILAAEDNPVNQLVLRRLLEQAGARVQLVANGELAVAAARARRPDIVLLDCYMPVMDGFDAARALRSIPGFEDLPILAVTASVTSQDRERVRGAGMDGLVGKPIDPATLIDTVRRVLSRRERALRANRPVEFRASS